jgi:hypothetical protein
LSIDWLSDKGEEVGPILKYSAQHDGDKLTSAYIAFQTNQDWIDKELSEGPNSHSLPKSVL